MWGNWTSVVWCSLWMAWVLNGSCLCGWVVAEVKALLTLFGGRLAADLRGERWLVGWGWICLLWVDDTASCGGEMVWWCNGLYADVHRQTSVQCLDLSLSLSIHSFSSLSPSHTHTHTHTTSLNRHSEFPRNKYRRSDQWRRSWWHICWLCHERVRMYVVILYMLHVKHLHAQYSVSALLSHSLLCIQKIYSVLNCSLK